MQLGEVASFIDGAVALRGAESALGLLLSPMRRALWELFLRDHGTKKLHLAESGALSDTTSAHPSGARVSQLANCATCEPCSVRPPFVSAQAWSADFHAARSRVSQAWFGEARELISDEILQVLVLSLLIASACVGWQIQDVLNRCHNAFQDPMDTRQAQGSPASPIWRPMWSAWLRADRPGRSFGPGGREGPDIWPWPPGRRQDRNSVPAVTGA